MPSATPWTWIWSAVGALALAGALAAAEPPAPKGPLDHLPAEIRTPLLQADGHLRRQEWEPARGLLQGLLAAGAEDPSWKGSYRETLWRLAVAEAGMGRAADALWHWQALQPFGRLPPSATDLAPYGAAAAELARTPLREPAAAPAGLAVDRGPGLTPPRRTAGEALDLRRLQEGAPPLWARVELVVDADGRVQAPAVLDSTSGALTYRMLEAVRGWRYEPARRDGKPVATLLTVNVNSPREQPLAEIAPPAGPLADIDRLLLAGTWGDARRRGDLLWTQALHNAAQTRPAFALLLTQRALAEAGLGETDLAVCHWHAAQGLMPELFHADLSAYGAAGTLLEARRWGYPIWQPGAAAPPAPDPAAQVMPPKPRRRPKPEIPNVARKPGTRGTVVIASVIEKTGAVAEPIVLPQDLGTEPNFAASGLDTICHWRFAPATRQGEPVRVYYSLTVNFTMRH